jgi:putative protease
LYYSIYHPVLLITSRQCLFHQVIGCDKNSIDEECIQQCSKSSSITRINDDPLFIEKTKGNYHCIYNDNNFLNTSIIRDMPDKFSSFLVDLRDVKTETKINIDKGKILTLFENFLNADLHSAKELHNKISPTTQSQYTKGI